jgi:nucleotide-binding universal stress UspA family protein
MNKILFPTDFSNNANKAMYFAAEVAQFTGADLILLHAQHVPAVDVQEAVVILESAMEEMRKASTIQIKALQKDLEERYFLKNIKTSVEFGFARDLIIDKADEMKVDLVIMGTKGSGDAIDNLLGGVTTNVMKGMKRPLLVIPSGAGFHKFKKIAFASRLEHDDEEKFRWFLDFTNIFKPKIHLLHVLKEEEELTGDQQKVLDTIAKTSKGIHFVPLNGSSIAASIEKYLEEQQIELLAMRAGDRGFFEDLFHKSVTRHVVTHTKTPIIIFH